MVPIARKPPANSDYRMNFNKLNFHKPLLCFFTLTAFGAGLVAANKKLPPYPPGWIPIRWFESDEKWDDDFPRFRSEAVHLYLPNKNRPVDGVFVCLVFTSPDPREFADVWNFALVTIPFPFTYDLGDKDHRNQSRAKTHEPQGMQLLLRYLDDVAKQTNHPELSKVPIVGWMGQAGPHYLRTLYDSSPERVLAWADAFPSILRSEAFADLPYKVPFAYSWEVHNRGKAKEAGKRVPHHKLRPVFDDLSSNASTYGFKHGIYSKFHFFTSFFDRCIKARMPDKMPPPGQPVKLKPIIREEGWLGDFMPISEWNPIAPANSEEAKAFVFPSWLPDKYAAHIWRAYHSGQIRRDKPYFDANSIRITDPVTPYSRGRNRSKYGAGYGCFLYADTPFDFTVEVNVECSKVIYYDGDKVIGEVTKAPWNLKNAKLEPGLRAVYAVAVKPDGSRVTSRCTFPVVKKTKEK